MLMRMCQGVLRRSITFRLLRPSAHGLLDIFINLKNFSHFDIRTRFITPADWIGTYLFSIFPPPNSSGATTPQECELGNKFLVLSRFGLSPRSLE